MPSLQLIIVAIYFAILFCVGAWASRLIGDATDFLLAGRRLGLVLATATLCATHFGGGFVMGSGEWGFSHGVTGIAYAVGEIGRASCRERVWRSGLGESGKNNKV